jgi:hypothetical protein
MNRTARSVPSTPTASRLHSVSLALLAAAVATACSGGGGGGGAGAGTGGGGGGPANVQATLTQLGVATPTTPRLLDSGTNAPATYAPLGARPALNKTSELVLFGIGRAASPTSPSVTLELTSTTGAPVEQVLTSTTASAQPWVAENYGQSAVPRTLRMPVAGDFDGDGREEVAAVYWSGNLVRVALTDDASGSFAISEQNVLAQANVSNVAGIAGDLDGDGRDELVVGLTVGNQATVRVFRRTATDWASAGPVRTFAQTLTGATIAFQFAVGNLDNDAALELAIGVNQTTTTTGQPSYAVWDDLVADLNVLRSGAFTGVDQGGTPRAGLSVSVAIGDVDGDNRGEVLLGGVTNFADNCDGTRTFFQALDDAPAGLPVLASASFLDFLQSCGSGDNPRLRTVHLNALDLDGDRVAEVQANQFVFDDFRTAPWSRVTGWQLPQATIWNDAQCWYDRNTSSMVVGDFTGDGRDDIATYRLDRDRVEVFALPAIATSVQLARTIIVPLRNSDAANNPVLVRANVDTDSPVLQYSAAEYALVYTEPIVLAALAAPPTRAGIQQNVAGSFTAFGNTNTTINEQQRSLTFSTEASIGVNLDGGPILQSELELKATLKTAATRVKGTAYELSRTIVFTSAPTEDTIVFTCVPVDRYTYTILSHPDANLVGQKVQINLPRSPITLQAERSFYNASVQPGAQVVDSLVFDHAIGNPASYPGVARRNQLLANGGLSVGPQSVGQGNGTTEVTLQVGQQVSQGGSLAVGFEKSLQVTVGGVLAGISIGVESSRDWRISSGSSTTYTGVVGAIGAADFAANRYSFGLLTYVFGDNRTGQQFQVLNYWVE